MPSDIKIVHDLISVLTCNNTRTTCVLFDQVTILVRLLLVLPSSSCTAERLFSSLRRFKIDLRSTMTAQRLTVNVLHIHKDRTSAINTCCPAHLWRPMILASHWRDIYWCQNRLQVAQCSYNLILKVSSNEQYWVTRPFSRVVSRKRGKTIFSRIKMQNNWGVLEKNGIDLPLLFHMHEIWSVNSQEELSKLLPPDVAFKAKMHQIRFRLGLRPRPH